MLSFIHITDCHLGNNKNANYRGINTYKSLEKVCHQISLYLTDQQFILVTGDISQTGDKSSYEIFHSLLSQFELPIYCLPGNHDNPQVLQKFFPDSPTDTTRYLQINGIGLALINTVVENEVYGEVAPLALKNLELTLQENAKIPTIVAMHHPVIMTHTPWMDEICLKNKNIVKKVLQQYENVKLVLSGHAHMLLDENIKHTRFIGPPSTCFQFKQGSLVPECDKLAPCFMNIDIQNDFDVNYTLEYISM